MNPNQCPICQNRNIDYIGLYPDVNGLIKKEFKRWQCWNCRFDFIFPQPTSEEKKELYPESFYSKEKDKNSPFSKIFLLYENYCYKKRLNLVSRFVKRGKLLDVGSGNGKFLKIMKDAGFDIVGVEPSCSAAKVSQENFGIMPINKDLPEADLGSRKFDVVTLWHVLEHVEDLNNYIVKIKNIVEDDGVLIVAVPNIDSFDAKFMGISWPYLNIPTHINNFNINNLKLLLEKHGFKIKNTSFFSLEYDLTSIILGLTNLISEDYNFIYKKIKRQERLNTSRYKNIFNFAVFGLLSTVFLPVLLIYILLAAIFKKSSSFTVVAHR